MATAHDRVLVALTRPPRAGLDVVIFPGAGSGPSAFSGWGRLMPAHWRLAAVCLPGREGLAGEPAATSIPEATRAVTDAIAAWRNDSAPIVYLGHSLGAWLALDTALALAPTLLAAVACAPQDGPLHYGQPEVDLLRATTREQGAALGIDAELLDEVVDATVAVMLGDIRMANGYLPPAHRLGCDIVAYYGTGDPTPQRSWSRYTTGRAGLVQVDGDHHFLKRQPQQVIDDLCDRLAPRRGESDQIHG